MIVINDTKQRNILFVDGSFFDYNDEEATKFDQIHSVRRSEMQVKLKLSGHDLSPSLRTLIEQHFRFAASPFKSTVQALHVTLSDVPGSGAGTTKCCEAELRLSNGKLMTIQWQDPRAEYAIQRVAEQLVDSLRRVRGRRSATPAVTSAA